MTNTVDSKFIINLQGKDFVTYEGLLSMAHDNGLKSIIVDIVQLPSKENGNTCICTATATTEDKIFTDIGDANPANTNSFIGKHLIRMASTRAKARALRDLNNIGMTALEELGDDSNNMQKGYNRNANTNRHNRQNNTTNNTNNNKTSNVVNAKNNNQTISEAEVKALENLIEMKKQNVNTFLKFNHVNNLSELTKEQADGVRKFLASK